MWGSLNFVVKSKIVFSNVVLWVVQDRERASSYTFGCHFWTTSSLWWNHKVHSSLPFLLLLMFVRVILRYSRARRMVHHKREMKKYYLSILWKSIYEFSCLLYTYLHKSNIISVILTKKWNPDFRIYQLKSWFQLTWYTQYPTVLFFFFNKYFICRVFTIFSEFVFVRYHFL